LSFLSSLYPESRSSTTDSERRSTVQIVIPRFRVGWMVITPGALVALLEAREDPKTFVYRHMEGDWSDVGPADWAANEYGVRHGERLFSVYHTRHGRKLWVVTEANRYATTILLSEDLSPSEERSL
jgi:hypothetical protein